MEKVDALDGDMPVLAVLPTPPGPVTAEPLVLVPVIEEPGPSETASSKILTDPSLHAVAMRSVPRTLNGAHATSRTSAGCRGSFAAS